MLSSNEMPVPGRDARQDALLFWLAIAGILMGLPVVAFLWGFFGLMGKAVAVLLIFAASATQGRALRLRNGPPVGVTAMAFLLGLWAALLPGYGGVFVPTGDIPKHVMIFKELLQNAWPVHHDHCEIPGMACEVYLRYVLGYYALPALIGKALALSNLNLPIILWTAMLYGSLFMVAATLLQESGRSAFYIIPALLVFFFFGDVTLGPGVWDQMVPPGGASDKIPYFLRYQFENFPLAMTMQWTPQHGIPALYGAVFFLAATVRRYSLAECALAMAIICAWSPMAGIGFTLLVLVYWLRSRPPWWPGHNILLGVGIMSVTVVMLGMLMLYYAGESDIPKGIAGPAGWTNLVNGSWGLLLVGWLCLRKSEHRFLWLLWAALCVFPVGHVGFYNDFGRYTSLPALMALKLLILKELLAAPPARVKTIAAALLIALSVYQGVQQTFVRGAYFPSFAPSLTDFDPQNNLVGMQRAITKYNPQYYAPCPKESLMNFCR